MFVTSLIFSWVIGLQGSTRDSVDIKALLLYELALLSDSGDLLICKAKSELKKQLQSVISVQLTEKEITSSILDGFCNLVCSTLV